MNGIELTYKRVLYMYVLVIAAWTYFFQVYNFDDKDLYNVDATQVCQGECGWDEVQ